MSASKLVRSGSESWSVMPHTAHDGLTDTATATAASPCETHDAALSALPTQRAMSDVDNTAVVMREAGDDMDDRTSDASADSWVEVTAAELQSLPATPPAAAEPLTAAAASPAAAEVEEDAAATSAADDAGEKEVSAPAEEDNTQTPESVTLLRPAAAEVMEVTVAAAAHVDDAEHGADAPPTPESFTMLRPAEEVHEAEQPQQPQEPQQHPSSPPPPPSGSTLDLSEFLAGLALTRAYDAPAAEKAPTEQEAAALALASFDASEPTDDFTVLAAEDREMEETVDVDVVSSSVQAQRRGRPATSPATAAGAAVVAPTTATGVTAVLRRRMVAEDWMRTLRGPSPLSPEERVEVFQALFGDPGTAPISAERFKEMMVPYDRHCDCLGASYGFHHQGCRFKNESQLTS